MSTSNFDIKLSSTDSQAVTPVRRQTERSRVVQDGADLRDRWRCERKVGAPKRLRPDEIRARSRCTEMTPTSGEHAIHVQREMVMGPSVGRGPEPGSEYQTRSRWQCRAPSGWSVRSALMSLLLAHGVRGPRLRTSCLRRARTLGLRTYGVRHVWGRGRGFEDTEARSSESLT